MRRPEEFITPGQKHLACKRRRSTYGFKQSSRCWNPVLDGHLMDFVQMDTDLCVYRSLGGDPFFLGGVYIHNIFLTTRSSTRLAAGLSSFLAASEEECWNRLHSSHKTDIHTVHVLCYFCYVILMQSVLYLVLLLYLYESVKERICCNQIFLTPLRTRAVQFMCFI